MPTVALHTLGCKVNQYETQKIADEFHARGFTIVEFAHRADIYVVNSCTVTHTADAKSRQAARAAAGRNPDAIIVLTGCYAETSPSDAALVDGVSLVLGNKDKPSLVEKVARLYADRSGFDPPLPMSADTGGRARGRTRAVLKVQDGCDQYCAYCAIPLARPDMSSRSVEEVAAEAGSLAGDGFTEIVLAGIRLGRYDDAGRGLVDLIERLAGMRGIERIRLSSIELTDIPERLVDLMAADPKVCRHLHIPLQSGDDNTLRRMNRPYSAPQFEQFVEYARARVDGLAVTTDIMVGFPGETEDEFLNTYRCAERIRFSRTHVFRYSRRSGTAAASLPEQVPAQDKDRRSARLMSLAAECANEFASLTIGGRVNVLIEGKRSVDGLRMGHTDNYVTAYFDGDGPSTGEIVEVGIEQASNGSVYGRLVE